MSGIVWQVLPGWLLLRGPQGHGGGAVPCGDGMSFPEGWLGDAGRGVLHTLPRPCEANRSLPVVSRRLSGNVEAEPQRVATTARSRALQGGSPVLCDLRGSGCGLRARGGGLRVRGGQAGSWL